MEEGGLRKMGLGFEGVNKIIGISCVVKRSKRSRSCGSVSRKGNGLVVGNKKPCLQWFAWGVSEFDQSPAEGRTDRRLNLLLLADDCLLGLLIRKDLLAFQVANEKMADHLLLPRRAFSLALRQGRRQVLGPREGQLSMQSLGRRDWWQPRSVWATVIFSHNNYGGMMDAQWKRSKCIVIISYIMEFGKVIPEAEEALEHSLMMQVQVEQKFTPGLLRDMAKDVDKLISRLPYHRTLIKVDHEVGDSLLDQVEPERKPRDLEIGKYNPLGQIYRYQQAEFQQQISKPTHHQTSKTQQKIDPSPHKQYSMRDKDSIFAQESLNNSQIKFPTHNYYIMFDKKRKQEKTKLDKASRTVCLERKVQKLEDEVKLLRGSNGKGTASTGWHRSDGKMKLEKLLDSIIG